MRIVGRISIAVVALALVSLIQTPAAFAANGALKVTSFPSGAAVTIDGIFTGKYKLMNEPLLARFSESGTNLCHYLFQCSGC